MKDRGYVSVGQTAKVKLANQDQLIFGTIDAKIISISPDAVRGQTSTWYELELEIDKEYFISGDPYNQFQVSMFQCLFLQEKGQC